MITGGSFLQIIRIRGGLPPFGGLDLSTLPAGFDGRLEFLTGLLGLYIELGRGYLPSQVDLDRDDPGP